MGLFTQVYRQEWGFQLFWKIERSLKWVKTHQVLSFIAIKQGRILLQVWTANNFDKAWSFYDEENGSKELVWLILKYLFDKVVWAEPFFERKLVFGIKSPFASNSWLPAPLLISIFISIGAIRFRRWLFPEGLIFILASE